MFTSQIAVVKKDCKDSWTILALSPNFCPQGLHWGARTTDQPHFYFPGDWTCQPSWQVWSLLREPAAIFGYIVCTCVQLQYMCTDAIHVYMCCTFVHMLYIYTAAVHVYMCCTCVQPLSMCKASVDVYSHCTCVQLQYICTSAVPHHLGLCPGKCSGGLPASTRSHCTHCSTERWLQAQAGHEGQEEQERQEDKTVNDRNVNKGLKTQEGQTERNDRMDRNDTKDRIELLLQEQEQEWATVRLPANQEQRGTVTVKAILILSLERTFFCLAKPHNTS